MSFFNEYFFALMTGIGIGMTIYAIGAVIVCTLNTISDCRARVKLAAITARMDAVAALRRAVNDAKEDEDYAARLAALDARAAAANERMATPADRATV
jgi:hypothetical protein